MTQLTEARTTGSFGTLVDVVSCGRVLILSGAGLSTESGIPDYRGPTGLARRAQPMTYQVFTGSAAARRRYWARSYLGWRHVARAAPNDGHHAVAELSRRGLLTGIITQNVDGLHQAAGAFGVTELHGSLHRVICLSCGQRTARTELERRLEAANPAWDTRLATSVNPDGDAVLDHEATESFQIVDCSACHGVLKPDVVFFGEPLPSAAMMEAFRMARECDLMLVVGSSLQVYPAADVPEVATDRNVPVVIVNDEPTPLDVAAAVVVRGRAGEALPEIARLATAGSPPA